MLEQNIEGVRSTLEKYDFPQDIIVETIAYCNLQCIMCPQWNLKRPRGKMSFDLFKKIVNEVVKENDKTRIWPSLMGDATLLGDGMIDMVKYASLKGVRVHLNTNGILLERKLANDLIYANPREIIFGIDAVTPETYSKIRKGGNYYTVIRNIKYVIEHKQSHQKVGVQFIEMEENTHEMEAFKKFWLDYDVTVKLRPKIGWGNTVKTEYLVIPEEKRIPCAWLMRTCSIRWNGEMSQCDSDHEGRYCPGNINKQTIKEVWNGELAKRRERHWQGDFSHEPCVSCKDWQAGRSYFYGSN